MAICVGPKFNYNVVKAANGEIYIMAEELTAAAMSKAGLEEYEVVASLAGKELSLINE